MKKKAAFKLSIGIVLLCYLLWYVDVNGFVSSIRNADILILFLVYFTFIVGTLISTFKWKILLKAQSIKGPGFLRLWALYHVGAFFSNFLPTEVGGDLVRSYAVGKESGKQSESLAAVAMERITGLLGVVIYAVVGLFLNKNLAYSLNLTYLVYGFLMCLIIVISIFSNRRLAKWVKNRIYFKQTQKVINKCQSIYEAFYLYKRDYRILFQTMGISMIFQLYAVWYTFALMRCLQLNPSFTQLLLIVPVITLVGMVPITINSIGIREGAFVYIFTYIGVSGSQSLALALVYRIGLLMPSLVGGIFYSLNIFQTKKCKDFDGKVNMVTVNRESTIL